MLLENALFRSQDFEPNVHHKAKGQDQSPSRFTIKPFGSHDDTKASIRVPRIPSQGPRVGLKRRTNPWRCRAKQTRQTSIAMSSFLNSTPLPPGRFKTRTSNLVGNQKLVKRLLHMSSSSCSAFFLSMNDLSQRNSRNSLLSER